MHTPAALVYMRYIPLLQNEDACATCVFDDFFVTLLKTCTSVLVSSRVRGRMSASYWRQMIV